MIWSDFFQDFFLHDLFGALFWWGHFVRLSERGRISTHFLENRRDGRKHISGEKGSTVCSGNLFVIARNALLEFFVRVKKNLDVKHKPVSHCFGETNVSPCFGSVQFGKRMRSNDCTIVERFPYSRLPTKDSRIANAGPSRLPPKAIMQSSQSFWFCVEPLTSSQTVFFAHWPQDGTLQVLALGEFSEKHPFEIVELDQLESGRGSDSMVGVLPWLESLAEFCQWKTPGNLWSVFFWMLQIVLEIEDVFGSVEGVISWFGDIYGLI